MLKITTPKRELYNEDLNEFITIKPYTLQLEHSLVSLAKWESKWNKPFLSREDKTRAETIDYIRCMTVTQNVPDEVYNYLSSENIDAVNRYISDPMTATTFSDRNGKTNRSIITAEIIYYWMFSFGIPMECQKWHLNRLLTLIRVFDVKNNPPKKMSPSELKARNTSLNALRRKQLGTKG